MAVTPRFEADISADISRFITNMAKVDKKIKDYASGVVIDIQANISDFMSDIATVESTIQDINNSNSTININGDISDLERAIQEANAGLAGLNNDPTVNINGNSSNFNQAASNVNRQTNSLSRRITEARIGADIGSFESRMVEVARSLAEAGETVTPEIELELNNFTRDMVFVQDRMREIARTTADPQVEADIAGFMAQMALVEAQLSDVVETHDIDIRADTGRARTRLALLWLQIRSLTARDFVVSIRSSWRNYQETMGALAAFSRNFSEIAGMVGGGIKVLLSPAVVPVIASVVGLLGNLGPLLGTIIGSTFALASSFGVAALGAAGFAAVAIPSIGKVITNAEELKKIEEKLEKATTWEARNKLMKEQSKIMDGMSDAQRGAGEALNQFKANYSGLVKDMENPVLDVFAGGLTAITGILDLARPMIENVTDTIKGMMDTLNANLEAADVKDFFNFLSTSAGPALEAISSAIGNFIVGLFNMFAAFGPLSTETQNSFLKMSESFRSWSSTLSENKGFQKFTAYVSENMPKIRSIFSDAIKGVIFMFSAFGDSSSGMMTKLAEMTEGFLNWSKALGESQGFKNFIDYVQTNGPVVLSVIGNIVDFIINLGKAAAPAGEYLLSLVDSFLGWSNAMMVAHPWLGKILVGAVMVAGGLMAITAPILLVNALFGKMVVAIVTAVAKMIWGTAVMIANFVKMSVSATITAARVVAGWVLMGVQATAQAIRVAAAWLLSTGAAVVTAIATTTVAVATIIAQWTLMALRAAAQAILVAAAWTLSTGMAMATAIASTTVAVATVIGQWVLMGAQALVQAARVAGAWLLSTGAAMATAVAGMVATSAVFVAKWTLMAVQALAQAARMAAAWLIAMGPIGWAIAAVVGLTAVIIANWDKISAWTSKTWSTVSDWITKKWADITSKTKEATTNMWNSVKEKFTSIVNSVKEKMDNAKTTVSNKWEEAKAATATKIASILSTVISKFSEIVSNVKSKMDNAKQTISTKWEEAKAATATKIASIATTVATKFSEIVTKVKTKMAEAKENISNKWEEIKSTAASKLAQLVTSVGTFFAKLVTKVREKMGEAVDAVGEFIGQMPGKITSFVGEMVTAGAELVGGVISGIKSKISEGLGVIGGLATSLISRFKSDTDTHSPSRAFADVAKWFAPGIVKGIEATGWKALDAVTSLSNGLTSAFNPNFATQSIGVEMNRMDYGSELDALSAQVKRELSVDMNVNHSGAVGGSGGGFNQTVVINSPRELSPSENARHLKKAGQQQAMQWGLS